MYKLRDVDTGLFKGAEVPNQEEIIRITGKKLDLLAGFEKVKAATDNFAKPHKDAREVDIKFVELMEKMGLLTNEEAGQGQAKKAKKAPAGRDVGRQGNTDMELGEKKPANTAISMATTRERERARALDLIKIELELLT